ncbi:MAG TPA: hypothetical protein VF876_03155, partial [Burkholderiales bacterium]
LEKPPAEEREAIEGSIARALEVMPQILAGDLQGAMQKLHSGDKPVAAKPEQPRAEPKEAEPSKAEPKKAEPKRAEPAKQEAKKAEAKAPEAKKPETPKSETAKPQPPQKEEKAGGLKGFFKGLTGSKK